MRFMPWDFAVWIYVPGAIKPDFNMRVSRAPYIYWFFSCFAAGASVLNLKKEVCHAKQGAKQDKQRGAGDGIGR